MAERVGGPKNAGNARNIAADELPTAVENADVEVREAVGQQESIESLDSIENPDGSSARASTADGHLDAADVTHAPFVEGTDPLSDDAIERRRPAGTPMTPQLVIFGILIVFFAYFFISDVVHGSWGKAALGALVLAVCALAIVREVRGKR